MYHLLVLSAPAAIFEEAEWGRVVINVFWSIGALSHVVIMYRRLNSFVLNDNHGLFGVPTTTYLFLVIIWFVSAILAAESPDLIEFGWIMWGAGIVSILF